MAFLYGKRLRPVLQDRLA